MKRILIFLFTITIGNCINAQNVVIPDANFKAYLVGNSSINLNNDSEIQMWESAAFNGTINVSGLGINDLTGIGAFSALTSLNCSNNSLTSLNIANNMALNVLYCYDNSLTSLNLIHNTALSALRCQNNSLNALDLSANTALTSLLIYNNQLISLNVANGNNTNILGGFFNTTNNPNLICITVDDVAFSTANWSNIDAIASFSTNCACTVTIPDTNFKNYLINNTAINTSGDTEIQCYEASLFTGTISVNNLSIANLTGIETFTALTGLNCLNNSLTNIDISQNILLTSFSCNNNQLNALDISNNTLLTVLACRDNQITSLDVSNNTLLEYFSCHTNNLTSLDVSNNTNLIRLWCYNNQLTNLNIKNGNNDNMSNANFKVTNNPNLTCIDVDDVAWSTTNWTNIDAIARFSLDCSAPVTYVPDDNFENVLIYLGYDTALDNYVPTANINTVTLLNLSNNNISNLTGIEGFIALETLYLSNNFLTTLDLSSNLQLTFLNIFNNLITNIDLSANVNLSELLTNQNPLTELDLRQNTALTKVKCINNSLISFDIRNGNNTAINNSNFSLLGNNSLACASVDDTAWSTANWSNIETSTNFNTNCSTPETYVPDNNFEQALIDLGYDSVLDNYVTTGSISSITNLNISNKSISNLTGIEDFSLLQILNCNDNNLSSLDIAQNTALTSLRCSTNVLTSLDISQNINLGLLICSQNYLTSLDITQNLTLHTLNFSYNGITSLDVTQNTQLSTLICSNNNIISLNLSQNTLLEDLNCNTNQLTFLDIKNGTNGDVSNFDVTNNLNLVCIEVDDAAWSTTNWTNIDATASFSEDCSSTASAANFDLENTFSIYPNPAKNSFKIESDLSISRITVFNHLGKKIVVFNPQETYDVSSLANGIYFIQIKSNNIMQLQKLIISSF